MLEYLYLYISLFSMNYNVSGRTTTNNQLTIKVKIMGFVFTVNSKSLQGKAGSKYISTLYPKFSLHNNEKL